MTNVRPIRPWVDIYEGNPMTTVSTELPPLVALPAVPDVARALMVVADQANQLTDEQIDLLLNAILPRTPLHWAAMQLLRVADQLDARTQHQSITFARLAEEAGPGRDWSFLIRAYRHAQHEADIFAGEAEVIALNAAQVDLKAGL